MSESRTETGSQGWQSKPWVAFLIRAFVLLVPIVSGVIASLWLSQRLPAPQNLWQLVGWWAVLIAVSTGVLYGVDRLARRLLPLAALMQLTVVFPDQAPGRFKTALRAGASNRRLEALIDEAASLGDDDLTRASEIMLELTAALSTHDPRTRGHAERVRAYVELISEEMGLAEEDRQKLRWAALMHDMGKLKISTDILNKPGKLDDDEWAEIKKHTLYGTEICAPLLPWLGEWGVSILDHHERYDGKGYPHGKAAEEISLGGRIVCVADCYDVMTSVRSYKQPMSAAASREELARHAAAQFDPVVVRNFLNMSMGRMRWVAGPLTWLAQFPLLNLGGVIQQIGTGISVAGMTAVTVGAAAASGFVDYPTESFAPPAVIEVTQQEVEQVIAAATTTTTVPAPGATTTTTPPLVVAEPDSGSTEEDAPFTFAVLANDLVRSGTVLSIVQEPGFGTVIVNDDGTVTYIPDDDFSGTDGFIYRIAEPDGEWSEAAVAITVEEVNDPPVAFDDEATVAEDASTVVPVTENDVDSDDGIDPASIVVIDGPFNGTATVDPATGTITYLPNADFAGTDGFTYQVADLAGEISAATVNVTVTQVNDPPVARNDSASVREDETVVISVLANDSDIEGGLASGTLAITVPPAFGSAVVSGTTISYTPAVDFNGSDIVLYRVCDTAGACATARATITVTPVNDPPVVPGPGPITVDEGTTYSFDPLAGATDADGDALSMVSFDPTSSLGGTIVEGSLVYTAPTVGAGTDSFTYTVGDGFADVAVTVVITITDIDVAPIGNAPEPDGFEDAPLIIDLAGTYTDPDGEPISIATLDGVSAAGGIVTDNGDGTITYTPPPNWNGTDTFSFTVTDGTRTTTGTVAVNVAPVPDDPVAADDTAITAEDVAVVIAAALNDSDVDGDLDPATITVAPPLPTIGAAVANPGGTISFIPAPDFFGNASFGYEICDALGACDIAAVTITITPVNDAPVAAADGGYGVAEGGVLDTVALGDPSVLGNDTDAEGDGLTAVLDAGPAHAAGFSLAADGSFTYTHDGSETVTDSFTYHAFDGTDPSGTVTVTITITPVNDAPVAVNDAVVIDEEETVVIPVAGNDTDAEGLDLDSVVIVSPPGKGTATPGTGSVEFVPDPEASGADSFVYRICDNDPVTPLCDMAVVTITITPVNDAPVAAADGGYGVAEGGVLDTVALGDPSVLGNDTDAEGDGLTAVLDAGPAHAAGFSLAADGSFTYTHDGSETVSDSFTYHAFDGTDPSGTVTVTITITPVNDAPVAVNDAVVIDEEETVVIPVAGNDTDAEGLDLDSVVIVSPPGKGTATPGTGSVEFVPDPEASGADSFVYRICDNDPVTPLCDMAVVTITITPVNDVPVAAADGGYGVAEGGVLDTVALGDPSVLGNDTDAEGDGLTAVLDAGPAHAAGFSLAADGSFTYTHDGSETVSDSFTYHAFDGTDPSGTVTVTITITPVNDAPVATADGGYLVVEGGVLDTVVAGDPSVLANDTDAEGDGLTAVLDSGPAHAAGFGLAADGSFTYTHDGSETVTDSFTYHAFDGTDPSGTVTVTITVGAVNDPPVAIDDDAATEQGVSVAIPVLGNDTDAEGPVAIDSWESPTGNGGTVTEAGGVLTYSPAPAFQGLDTFTYTIRDSGGATDSAVVSVWVGFLNAVDDSATVAEDEALGVVIPVLSNDSGGALGFDPASLAVTGPASDGTTAVNGIAGTITYVPDPDFAGSDGFTYEICDNDLPATCDTAVVSVTITPENDAPVAVADGGYLVLEGGSLDTAVAGDPSVLANDTDVEGDGLTAVLDSGPAHAAGFSLAADGSFTYSHDGSETVTDSFTYHAFDGTDPSGTVTVTITVGAVNDDPVAQPDGIDAQQDQPQLIDIALDLLANDTDAEFDSLNLAGFASPATAGGTVFDNGDGTLTFTPAPGFWGIDSFTYTVDDGNGGSDEATVSVTVNGTPVAGDDYYGITIDTPSVLPVTANDTDPEGELLTITGTTDGANGGLVAANGDGTVTYTPPAAYVGPDSFTYTISDGNGGEATAMVDVFVAVAGADLALTMEATPGEPAIEGEQLIYSITVVNHGPDPATNTTITVTLPPAGDAAFDSAEPTSGTCSAAGDVVTCPIGDLGVGNAADLTVTVYPVTAGATLTTTAEATSDDVDPNPGDTLASIARTVDGVPVVTGEFFITDFNTDLDFTAAGLLGNDSDPEGDPMTVALPAGTSQRGGIVTDHGDGTYTYTPPLNYSGPDRFEYEVCDVHGGCTPAVVVITVLDPVVYLRSAGTVRTNILPLSFDAPTRVLADGDPEFNYDSDFDANPGLTIRDGGASPTEADPEKRQYWDLALSNQIILSGPTDLTFFSAQDAGINSAEGIVFAYLFDCPPAAADVTSCSSVAVGEITANPWDTVDGFTGHVIDFGDVEHVFSAGRVLRLVVTVDKARNGKMWFGFDTAGYPAALHLSLNHPPVPAADVYSTDLDTALVITTAGLLANDTDADGDPLVFAGSDAVTAAGGTVADNGDGTLTYTPPAGFHGLDSFTYQICDQPYNQCAAATVWTATGYHAWFLEASGTVRVDALPLGAAPTDIRDDFDAAFDYDTDGAPGLSIKDGAALANEGDPAKRQWWDRPATERLIISGPATVDFWSVQQQWRNDEAGDVHAYLLDCAPDGGCFEVAFGQVASDPWDTVNAFTRHTIDFGQVGHVVDPGRVLRLMLAPDKARKGKMWFGFGTVDYPAVLTIGLEGAPTAFGDILATANDTPLPFTAAALIANDVNPSQGPLVATADAVTTSGGTVTDHGDGTFTYTPPAGFTGLDSFDYEVCDTTPECGSGTVQVAVGEIVRFLASDGVIRQDVLPLSAAPPTQTFLPDYDLGQFADESGLLIQDGGGLFIEGDPNKRQWWHETAPVGGIGPSGPATLTLWSEQDKSENFREGWVRLFLAECDADGLSNCVAFASAEVHATPWGADGAMVRYVYDFGEVYHTVPAGRVFRVMAAVDKAHNGKMSFAFDTVDYPSVLTVGFNGDPVGEDDPLVTGQDVVLVAGHGAVLGNDVDPDGDGLHVGRVDAVAVWGGSVSWDAVSIRYVPPAGFSGLDSFTYDVCDPFGRCDTATVFVAVGDEVWFLGSDGVTRRDVLPVSPAAPSAVVLGDFDSNLDPGLTIRDGAALADETDPAKRQWWDLPVSGGAHQVSGDVSVAIWTQQDNGNNAAEGQVRAFVLDCAAADGSDCQQVAVADTGLVVPWSTADGFVRFDLDFGFVAHTVDGGRVLRLMVAVDKAHNGQMWFAFDDVSYPAVVTVGRSGPPVGYDDVLTGPELVGLGFTAGELTGNDIDPAGGGLTVTPAGGSAHGGTITDDGGGAFTYTPAAGFFGLDEFTYEACDVTAACDTGTVRVAIGEYVGFLGSDGLGRPGVLPLSAVPPVRTVLPDYEPDLRAGLTIADGGGLFIEGDPNKRQWWDETAPAGGIELSGPTELVAWSAQDLYDTVDQGIVNAYLLDCAVGETDPALCTLIGSASRDAIPWQTTPEFVAATYDFGELYATVPAGRVLRLAIAVDKAKNARMWLAFDTTHQPSVLISSFNGDPVGEDDPLVTGQDVVLVAGHGAVLGNDVDPDGDGLHVGRVDAVAVWGGSVSWDAVSIRYVPPAGFSGLDSFTYDVCDPFGRCDTATVFVAVGDEVWFLGSDGVTRRDVLPVSPAAPSAVVLGDFDSNLDPGLTIRDGAALADETDPAKRQWWDLPVSGGAHQVSGDVSVAIWTQQDNGNNAAEGQVRAFVLDCAAADGSDCQQVAVADTGLVVPWSTADGFVRFDLDFGFVAHTVDGGRVLRLMVAVDKAHNGQMWFAFDDVSYPAVVTVGRSGPPVGYDDVLTGPELVGLGFTAGELTGNDIDPAGGGLTVTPAGGSAHGGTITDDGGGAFTYTPAAGFFGLDEFTYEACDVTVACDTGTVRVAIGEYVGFLGSDGLGRPGVLPLSAVPPVRTVLPDYEPDLRAGLTIADGGGLFIEGDPNKRQWWDETAPAGGIDLSGTFRFTLWSAQDLYDTVDQGIVNAYLLDCAVGETDPALCTLIGSASRDAIPWQTTPEFVAATYDFGDIDYTVPAGRALRLAIAVDKAKNARMWLAFDTTHQPSVLISSFNATPVPASDLFTVSNHLPLMFSDAVLMANDVEPDGDAIVVGRIDATTAAGGALADNGDGTYTYSAPASVWAGVDTFTYDICDPFGRCGTGTGRIVVGDSIALLGGPGTMDDRPLSEALPTNRYAIDDPAFDYDADNDPGTTIKEWKPLAPSAEMTQIWRGVLPSGFFMDGQVRLVAFAAMKDFNNAAQGIVEIRLRDCDAGGGGCATITTQTFTVVPWGPDGEFVQQAFDFGPISHEITPGRMLEARVRVLDTGGGEMWFAVDHVDYPSSFLSGFNRAPLGTGDVFTIAEGASQPMTAAGLMADDFDEDGDAFTLTTIDAAGTEGGLITDHGDGTFTYAPPSGYTGTDTFTYEICDVFADCTTVPVTVVVADSIRFLDAAGTTRVASLPFGAAPTDRFVATDPAFDYDSDGKPGLTLRNTGNGAAETALDKKQWWDEVAAIAPIDVSGTAKLTIWSTQQNYANEKRGVVHAYLIDCAGDGTDCSVFASSTIDATPWDTVADFGRHVFDFGDVAHTIPIGRMLRLMVVVEVADGGKMWIGFDAAEQPSVLSIGANAAPRAAADVVVTGTDVPWVAADTVVTGNDVEPDGDAKLLWRVDAVSVAGGSVVTVGAPITQVTYTPPAGFTGVDSFTYDVCDPFGSCDTATVQVAVGDVVEFLGSAGTARVEVLPLTATVPSTGTLDNYNLSGASADTVPGLMLKDGSVAWDTGSVDERQYWDVAAPAGGIDVSGPVSVTFWSHQDQFLNASEGHVIGFLLDCAGGTCVEFASGEVHDLLWGPDGEWVRKVIDFGEVFHPVPAGNTLRLALVVPKAKNGKMNFAFDTLDYPTVLLGGFNGTPVAAADVVVTGTDVPLVAADTVVTGNDVEPDGDAKLLWRVDAVSVEGGSVVTVGAPITQVTYTPPAGFTGVDSFTYDVCDPFGSCDTATVHVAVGDVVEFLGSAGTARVEVLPLTATVPSTGTLDNYNLSGASADTVPGLMLKDGSVAWDTGSVDERQYWDVAAPAGGIDVSGPVSVTFWSHQDQFLNAFEGHVIGFLLDCAGGTCVEFASGEVHDLLWGPDGEWVRKVIDFGDVFHPVPAGNTLRLALVVPKAKNGKMNFAFDTLDYPTVLLIN